MQTFTTINGADLKARLDEAARQGNKQAHYWSAYSFDVRPGVAVDPSIHEFHGSMSTIGDTSVFFGTTASGIDLLSLWKNRKPETQFILLTGNSSVNSAVDAMRKGAYDYVTKPVNPDELIVLIKRAIEGMRKDVEIDTLRRRLDQKFGLDQIIGSSKVMKDVFAKIDKMHQAPMERKVAELKDNFYPYCVAALSLLGLGTLTMFGWRYTPW